MRHNGRNGDNALVIVLRIKEEVPAVTPQEIWDIEANEGMANVRDYVKYRFREDAYFRMFYYCFPDHIFVVVGKSSNIADYDLNDQQYLNDQKDSYLIIYGEGEKKIINLSEAPYIDDRFKPRIDMATIS